MYLTKLLLNPTSYRVQKELSNPYQLHRTIMRAFPNNLKDTKKNGRILFRIEKDATKQYPSVLIQSTLCPNWEFLINERQYLIKSPLFKQFNYPKFYGGNKYWFRLFGNPTKKTVGKRVGMYKEIEQYKWLKRKAELAGFALLNVNITKKEEVTAKIGKNTKKMTFQGIQFEGALQIVNPEKFEAALKDGIGSGKAFGFGFLTISKL